MTPRRALIAPVSTWVAAIGLLCGSMVYGLVNGGTATNGEPGSVYPLVGVLLFIVSFATVGALLAWKRPANPIGWLLLAAGVVYALAASATTLGDTRWTEWLGSWLWGLGIGLAGTFLLLLFPTGTLPSRRWRPTAWLAAIGLATYAVGNAFAPGRISSGRFVNPVGVTGPIGQALRAMRGGFAVVLVAAVLAIISVGVRYRRSRGLEREQMKWLLYAAALILASILAQAPVTAAIGNGDLATNVTNAITALAFVAIPVAVGIAVLRYRLYDIDVVINRTLVYGLLAAFITIVYVAIVVGIGAALGHGTSHPNLGLSILATAVVAVAFQPVRDRVQRLANRLVYGKRATPYEVLAGFVEQVGGTYAAEDVLPRMARALAEGTAAASATVWVRGGSELRPAAAWPAHSIDRMAYVRLDTESVPDLPGASLTLAVVHRGETLGALTLAKPPGEPLSTTERKLAEDLAGQAGLVLRNVGLTQDLLARLRDIESSRARIVSAEDEERSRIQRRIREGARRELDAVAATLEEAAAALRTDPIDALADLAVVGERSTVALESLREVARGIYPPLLADKGLSAALEAQARRATVRVSVDAADVGRYAQDVESAVYFCCVEALDNAVAHGSPATVRVLVHELDGAVQFEVVDDGSGFDPATVQPGIGLTGMRDRVAALDGELRVDSSPGTGTRVSGSVPLVVASAPAPVAVGARP